MFLYQWVNLGQYWMTARINQRMNPGYRWSTLCFRRQTKDWQCWITGVTMSVCSHTELILAVVTNGHTSVDLRRNVIRLLLLWCLSLARNQC